MVEQESSPPMDAAGIAVWAQTALGQQCWVNERQLLMQRDEAGLRKEGRVPGEERCENTRPLHYFPETDRRTDGRRDADDHFGRAKAPMEE